MRSTTTGPLRTCLSDSLDSELMIPCGHEYCRFYRRLKRLPAYDDVLAVRGNGGRISNFRWRIQTSNIPEALKSPRFKDPFSLHCPTGPVSIQILSPWSNLRAPCSLPHRNRHRPFHSTPQFVRTPYTQIFLRSRYREGLFLVTITIHFHVNHLMTMIYVPSSSSCAKSFHPKKLF